MLNANHRPYTLIAELTYRCPLRCPYCSNPVDYARHADELDTETWLRVFREAEELGVVQLHFSGGEPLLQVDEILVEALHKLGFMVAVETNGTLQPPPGIDWVCVSPKAQAPLKLTQGHELKLVVPQDGVKPQDFEGLAFQHFSVQPMDGPHLNQNTAWAVRFCLENPRWHLSLQTHKMLGIR